MKNKSPSTTQEYIHPSSILIILILSGISALFIALSIAYVYTKVDAGMSRVTPPILFLFSTLMLVGGSYYIQKARNSYEDQELQSLYRSIMICLLITALFLIVQVIAWSWMISNQLNFSSGNAVGYLYAISGLHFLHVIAGIPFLGIFGWKVFKEIKSQEPTLLFIDDSARRKLKHIALYWHFIDILWIYLIIFFFINALI